MRVKPEEIVHISKNYFTKWYVSLKLQVLHLDQKLNYMKPIPISINEFSKFDFCRILHKIKELKWHQFSAYRSGTQLPQLFHGYTGNTRRWLWDSSGYDAQVYRTTHICLYWVRDWIFSLFSSVEKLCTVIVSILYCNYF